MCNERASLYRRFPRHAAWRGAWLPAPFWQIGASQCGEEEGWCVHTYTYIQNFNISQGPIYACNSIPVRNIKRLPCAYSMTVRWWTHRYFSYMLLYMRKRQSGFGPQRVLNGRVVTVGTYEDVQTWQAELKDWKRVNCDWTVLWVSPTTVNLCMDLRPSSCIHTRTCRRGTASHCQHREQTVY